MRHNRLANRSNPILANGRGGLALLEEPVKRNLIPKEEVRALEDYWRNDVRWRGVTRTFTAEKVLRLRGTMKIEHTIADKMSRKLWSLLQSQAYVHALGALTGN